MRYSILILIHFFYSLNLGAQSFYDPLQIQEIQINFPFSNWDQKLDSLHLADSDARLLASYVIINGQRFDSIGVRYKGNSTYNANRNKNPFNIKLDFIKSKQDYQGYTTLKLSNAFMDPSFLREVLGYYIVRQYLPAAEANFIKVYINGNFIGLFSNIESISSNFLSDHYYSSEGIFFQCDRPDKQVQIPGPCTPPVAGSALRYGSSDTSCYFNSYEIQSEYGWAQFINFMRQLNQNPANINQLLDIDRALWMLALNNFYVNLDSYSGSGHNYLMYQNSNGRFNTIPWDLNEFYGAFTNAGTGSNLSVAQMQVLSPTLHITNIDRPLISKLLSNPSWKKRYLAHLWTVLEDAEKNMSYEELGKNLQSLISSSVVEDKNKFFSDAAFQLNLNSDYTGPGMGGGKTYPGLISLSKARINFLKTTPEYKTLSPSISDEEIIPTNPVYNSTISLTAQINDANLVKLYYRYKSDEVFQEIEMHDDGNHNDHQANDGIYGAQIQIGTQNHIQYYYYAENSEAAKLSPQRAEYEYFEVDIEPAIKIEEGIQLNELMATNTNYVQDQDGEYDDWIEIYNFSGKDLFIEGLYLSDSREDLLKWAIPDTLLPKDSYLIVWADEDGLQSGLHANFKLSKSGEQIYLSRYDEKILDSVDFVLQTENTSLSRCNANWVSSIKPSYGTANPCSSSQSINPVELKERICWNNPFQSELILRLDNDFNPNSFKVYNSNGVSVYSQRFATKENVIDTENWPSGLYLLNVFTNQGSICIKLCK